MIVIMIQISTAINMIAGFPTETEEDLRASADFIRAAGFEKTHVFPYSAREGTPAAKLPQLTASKKICI